MMYILQVENLYKTYNHVAAVNGVSFSIKQGEIYGLLGPNGAGKSTLIKMISGIEKKDSGKIVFDETQTNINRYKKHLGIITQDIAVYPSFTAYENVSFFCSLYSFKGKELKRRVERALEFTGLIEYKDKKACEFSGGMLRRLHLACAIAHTPQLIIMDEPTVGIDPQSRNHILQSVKHLQKNGASIIYTSHYMEEVEEICDEICIIDKGKIIAKGRTDDIKSNLLKYNIYTIVLKNKIEGIENHIKKIKGVYSVSVKDNEITCNYCKDINILQKLVNTIFNNGGVIESIKDELPTLENVFLDLTGKKLRD
ncbi:ABC transporter ATP-binding protein [Intestinibacter bartlettii]|uniref:ABC transporter ATP-binding protein n=1 Tax=Intestinibacter bartlettii TaxID=261299 RepID=UPI002ED3760D